MEPREALPEYLRNLGIDYFVPRRALPGADPHPVYRKKGDSLLSGTAASPAAGRPFATAAAKKEPAPFVAEEEAVVFDFAAVPLGELLVIDDLSATGAPSGDWGRLLVNVLAACGVDCQRLRLRRLAWPPVQDNAWGWGMEAARDFMDASIGKYKALDCLLLLGEKASRFAPKKAEYRVFSTKVNINQALNQASQKPVLWRDLRDFALYMRQRKK